MVFSTIYFTFLFLPILLGVYFLAKERYRNGILLVASIFFYAYGEPKFVFVMLLSILMNYLFALGIGAERKKLVQTELQEHSDSADADCKTSVALKSSSSMKLLLVLDIACNLSIFFIFKYLDFAIGTINALAGVDFPLKNIALPIGISFFTFQALSYVIDVYRGDAAPQKNLGKVALYISLFPQLIAGPIVRYKEVAAQIDHRTVTFEDFGYGVKRFILGFGKKVLIANNMALIAEPIYGVQEPGMYPIALLWLGMITYGIQIYFDFSGYSDMAIGLGRMFGFRFEENFNYPYISKSFSEFWRRWHMSLGRWFRDYVYIPLGGSRKGTGRQVFNLFIVWLLTGIWHGANWTYIVWALSFFVGQMLEKFLVKPEKRKNPLITVLWTFVTLFGITFLWGIFTAKDLPSGLHYCACLLGIGTADIGLRSPLMIKNLQEYWFFLLTGVLFCTPIIPALDRLTDRSAFLKKAKTVVVPVGYLFIFLWAVSYLLLGAHNPFIYFNF